MLNRPSSLRLSLVLVALLALGQACRQGASAPDAGEPGAPPPALDDFTVRADAHDLLFQYVSPEGKLAIAHTVDEVPPDRRLNVIVLSQSLPKGALPAHQVILADLTRADNQGHYPFRLASRYGLLKPPATPAPEQQGGAALPSADDRVILFATRWCPHCRHAAQWLKSKGVAFQEMDVETDAAAQALLLRLGQEQALPREMLSSVPILFVKGSLVVGFDAGRIARLLGLQP